MAVVLHTAFTVLNQKLMLIEFFHQPFIYHPLLDLISRCNEQG
jgi:hypothetical protein